MVMLISRSGVAILLAAVVVLGVAACRGESDRSAGMDSASTDESGTSWEAFKRAAHADLDRAERDLEAARKGLAELERAEVDRWADRVKRAREEIAEELAEAPEKRRRDREELEREVEEIKREVAALIERLRSGESVSGRAPEEESP